MAGGTAAASKGVVVRAAGADETVKLAGSVRGAMSTTTETGGSAAETGGLVRSREDWDGRHWAVIGLALLTGVIHLYVGMLADPGFAPAFYAAGVGWFLGAAVFLTSFWRRWMYLLAAAYAVVQIGFWVLSGFQFLTVGVVDKLAELAFLALVLVLYRDRA